MAVGEPGMEAGGAINITPQVSQVTGLGQALDAGLQLATRLLGGVPAAPGVVPYNPALLSADQIRSVFESTPRIDYGAAEAGMAARRKAALEQQLANLDMAHREAVKGLDGAYNAVTQQLGVAQQNVGAGFADMVRQQGMVNAQAAQGAQGAQAQAAQMAGSLGLSSVGGQQAAAATDTGIQSMIASNAIDQGLLSSNAGAMSQYIGSVAPALATYGRFGAMSNLKQASMQARANAEAQSAAAGLEDYRRFQELGLQSDEARSNALMNALLGAQSTNVSAINQARQTNVAAQNARNTSIWQADVNRQETIASTGIKFAEQILEESRNKEKLMLDSLKNEQAQARWEANFLLKVKEQELKYGLSPEKRDQVATQAQKVKAALLPYASAGGYQSLVTKVDKITGRRVPVSANAALIDASGKFQPQNFLAWSQETGGNYGNVIAYLASAQMSGTIDDGDAREFIKQISKLETERIYLDATGLQQDDSRYQKYIAEVKKSKDYVKQLTAKEQELTKLWEELTIPTAGGKEGAAILREVYTEFGVPILGKPDATAPLPSRIPVGPEQGNLNQQRQRTLVKAQFEQIQKDTQKMLRERAASNNSLIPGSGVGMAGVKEALEARERLAELIRTNPWLINEYPDRIVPALLDMFGREETVQLIAAAKKDAAG